VLHVTPPPTIVYGTGVVPPDPEAEKAQLREMLHQKHPGDPKISQEFLLIQGDTVAEVLRVASERKADMIVLGTHGRTGLSRLLMGSVAEQILRQAKCPVLTARLPA
jgi:nucleotide-binding universal stress UspA family protein